LIADACVEWEEEVERRSGLVGRKSRRAEHGFLA
jgi:hypothetical protein